MLENGPVVGPVDTKRPWESKTIIVNAVLGILAGVSFLFPDVLGVSAWITANSALIGVVWGGLNIVLRLITKNAVNLRD